MTAINAYRTDTNIGFYTDGAAYDFKDSKLKMFSQKADILMHSRSIVASLGSGRAGLFLRAKQSTRQSFDELVEHCPEDIRDAATYAWPGDPINLLSVMGGWSDASARFELAVCGISGKSPWALDEGWGEVARPNAVYLDPTPSGEAMTKHCALGPDGKLELKDDAAWISFMEAQRHTRLRLHASPNLATGCRVGAFIQKTVMDRSAAYTSIIHRWPDEIGETVGASIMEYRSTKQEKALAKASST